MKVLAKTTTYFNIWMHYVGCTSVGVARSKILSVRKKHYQNPPSKDSAFKVA